MYSYDPGILKFPTHQFPSDRDSKLKQQSSPFISKMGLERFYARVVHYLPFVSNAPLKFLMQGKSHQIKSHDFESLLASFPR